MEGLTQDNLNLFVDELKKISQLEEHYEKLRDTQKQIGDEFEDVKDFIDYDENKIKRNVISYLKCKGFINNLSIEESLLIKRGKKGKKAKFESAVYESFAMWIN